LRAALSARPKDVEIHRHCGRSLARLGQFDQAVACWRRVLDQVTNDPEALKMITDLTLAKTKLVPSHANASGAKGPGQTNDASFRPRTAQDRTNPPVQVPRRARGADEEPSRPAKPEPAAISPQDQLRLDHEQDPGESRAALAWARYLSRQRNYQE